MCIVQSGDRYSFSNLDGTFDSLPSRNYLLKFDGDRHEFYLAEKSSFKLPKKIYGDTSVIDRWLRSWRQNSEKNLGILLSGVKGSGKTITAEKFCIESGLPVIIINDSFDRLETEFVDFLTDKRLGKCIIFIDEFEKVFSNHGSQDVLLSLMDGQYDTNLIFLLTVNESEGIRDYFNNRLNRIKYRKHYEGLEGDVIDSVIDDLLINKEHRDSIYKFFDKVNLRTFDLLVNIIKEMNLFGEDALKCGAYLNVIPERKRYSVIEIYDGKQYLQNQWFQWSIVEERFTLERDHTDFLPEGKQDYSISLSTLDCEISVDKQTGNITVFDPIGNFQFLLKEHKPYNLIF